MTGKFFVDTNVLIYLFSSKEPGKKLHCRKLINHLDAKNQLVWSTQVMQEFYSVMTKKHNEDSLEVKASFSLFRNFELVVNDQIMIEKAIEIQILNRLSFWDSLIISSALASKCDYLLTEDLHRDQTIQGLKIVSPFELKEN
ncbi:MAG: PIN domain-containing protein [Cyclobacteriaceae bacterium]